MRRILIPLIFAALLTVAAVVPAAAEGAERHPRITTGTAAVSQTCRAGVD